MFVRRPRSHFSNIPEFVSSPDPSEDEDEYQIFEDSKTAEITKNQNTDDPQSSAAVNKENAPPFSSQEGRKSSGSAPDAEDVSQRIHAGQKRKFGGLWFENSVNIERAGKVQRSEKTLSNEQSFSSENTGLTQTLESLSTSEPLQDSMKLPAKDKSSKCRITLNTRVDKSTDEKTRDRIDQVIKVIRSHNQRPESIHPEASENREDSAPKISSDTPSTASPSEDSEDQSLEDNSLRSSIPPRLSKSPEKVSKLSKPPEKVPKPIENSEPNTKTKEQHPNHLHPLAKPKNTRPIREKTQKESEEAKKAVHKLLSQLQNVPQPNVMMEKPKRMVGDLFDHQKSALPWMFYIEDCDPAGGILADEMGLGKTITMIAFIMESLRRERKQNDRSRGDQGGTLIVCPAHLASQWENEILQKGYIAGVSIYKEKKQEMGILRCNSVVITSYETLVSNHKTEEQILFEIQWRRVVLDEAHLIRNSDAVTSGVVTLLKAEKRWALTGTPIQNDIRDIFPILRFLRLKPFDQVEYFNKWMGNYEADGRIRLHWVIRAVMLRRTKECLVAEGKMLNLPKKINLNVKIFSTSEERRLYERVLGFSKTLLRQGLHQKREEGRRAALREDYRPIEDFRGYQLSREETRLLDRRESVGKYHILTLILRLRQICCHPALITTRLDTKDFENSGVKNIQKKYLEEANNLSKDLEEMGMDNPVFKEENASSKMEKVLEEVKIITQKNEKIVIVSEWVKYLVILETHLKKIPGISEKIRFYTGKQSLQEREKIVHKFNMTHDVMVLLLSLKAGGQGLNLTGANHVMLVDNHWNPQLGVQAEDRVHRIGQVKDVVVHRFVVEDTIEERIVQLQERKLKIAKTVLAGGVLSGGITSLQLEEMCSLFDVEEV